MNSERTHAFGARTGRRVVVSAYGETPMDALEYHISLDSQSPPDPSQLEATDVIVAVKSASVGWVDLLMTSGQYQHMAPPPYVPGLECAGEVVWVGEAVDTTRVGDRVLVDGFRVGPRSSGAYQRWGGFASWVVAPADALFTLPEGFSYDQACNLLANYETAYHCLIARGRLAAGEIVLVHGASGSTGLAAVHVAKLLGATVIATGRSPEKLAVVKAEGADHVVRTADDSGVPRPFGEEVRELTQGRKVDVVYDGVGGDISVESLRCVRFGARFLIVGWAATPFVAKGRGQRGAPNANLLPTNVIMMKGLDVLGCPTVISTVQDPGIRAPRLAQIWDWVNGGQLKPLVGPAYSISDYAEAMKAKWTSRHVGGCVLHPDE